MSNARQLATLGFDGSDLSLSGGVYLGGTGAANKLDDYEEGTWTVTVTVGTVNNPAQATYTKIGNVVHCQLQLNNFSNTTSTSSVGINLPFAAFSPDKSVIGMSSLTANVTGINDMNGYLATTTELRFYSGITSGAYDSLLYSNLNSITSMYIGFSYFAA